MCIVSLLHKDAWGFSLCRSHAEAHVLLGKMTREGWDEDRFLAYEKAERLDWLRERT